MRESDRYLLLVLGYDQKRRLINLVPNDMRFSPNAVLRADANRMIVIDFEGNRRNPIGIKPGVYGVYGPG